METTMKVRLSILVKMKVFDLLKRDGSIMKNHTQILL